MRLLGCVFILFSVFWYFLVPCIIFVLFVRVKFDHKKKKKFKTDLMTSFILLLMIKFLIKFNRRKIGFRVLLFEILLPF